MTDAKVPCSQRVQISGTIVERSGLPALRRANADISDGTQILLLAGKPPYQGRIKPCADMGCWLTRLSFSSLTLVGHVFYSNMVICFPRAGSFAALRNLMTVKVQGDAVRCAKYMKFVDAINKGSSLYQHLSVNRKGTRI